MSEGLKDTGPSKEKKEKSGKEVTTFKIKDFINDLPEAFDLRNREEAEKTEKFINAISRIKTSPIGRQEELSEEKEMITEEEMEKINIVPIGKNDKTNNLPRESTNNIRNDKRDESTSEYNTDNNKSNLFYYDNLINKEFLEMAKNFHNNNSEGKFANYGPKITQRFKDFIKLNQNLSYDKREFFIETIEEINRNHEMTNLINFYIKTTNYSILN